MRSHGVGRGAAAVVFGALAVIGGFVALGRSAAAVGPNLPLLPTLAPPSLPVITLPPLPTVSLPIATILPLPSVSLPIATILPLPSASIPVATRSPLPSASLPTVTSSPLPSASLPSATATPRPSASTPRPTAAPPPAATAVATAASTPAPPSTVPSRVVPATGSVGDRSANTGLIVSDVSPDRSGIVVVAAAHASAGQLAWLVPGLVLGLPGVLLLAIVAAQLLGAAAFLGLTRRTLGGLGIDTESPTN